MAALESTVDMYDLRMSEEVRPLYEKVKAFIAEEVQPMSEKFFELGATREDRWGYAPGQLELLQEVKDKAKANGLWNFFLPDAETGEGLSNLDYAYIAIELGKNPLASESMNCAAPDTGNMEVLERVGTEAQKEQWLKPLLAGEIRSAYAMTEPDVASSDAKNVACQAERDGDEWLINGEKYYISGAGDPRCKIMITMVQTSPDGPPHQRQSQILVPIDTPGVQILGPMHVFGKDDAPHGHMHIKFRQRPRAVREHSPRRRPRLRDQPGSPRPGPHPPLHACHRPGRKGARDDGVTRPQPRRLRQAACQARWQHRDDRQVAHRDRVDASHGAHRCQCDGQARQLRSTRMGVSGQGHGSDPGVRNHRQRDPDARRDRRFAVDAAGGHVHLAAHPASR